jgi:hypothetical protein
MRNLTHDTANGATLKPSWSRYSSDTKYQNAILLNRLAENCSLFEQIRESLVQLAKAISGDIVLAVCL